MHPAHLLVGGGKPHRRMRTCQLIDRLLRKGDPSNREIWRLKAAPTNFKIENPVTGVTGFSVTTDSVAFVSLQATFPGELPI